MTAERLTDEQLQEELNAIRGSDPAGCSRAEHLLLQVCGDLASAKAELAEAEQELDRERNRLAACSIAALGAFKGCCDEYKSASLDDVLRMRAELDRAKQYMAMAAAGVEATIRERDEANDKLRDALSCAEAAEAERNRLGEALLALSLAGRNVPIVRRPDASKGPPFSVCLGCKSEDGDDCKPDCWVSRLENALFMAAKLLEPQP